MPSRNVGLIDGWRFMAETKTRVATYIKRWRGRGYAEDIPDEVPPELEEFAPSYKAIACALLRNDMHLTALGFSAPYSHWYGAIKRFEKSREAV